jgi:hypothetical protein
MRGQEIWMRHGLRGTSFAGLASGSPAYRPLLMPLWLSPRALRITCCRDFLSLPGGHGPINRASAHAAVARDRQKTARGSRVVLAMILLLIGPKEDRHVPLPRRRSILLSPPASAAGGSL